MRHRLLVQPLAQDDLAEQAGYIAGDSIDAALRFLDATVSEIGKLSTNHLTV